MTASNVVTIDASPLKLLGTLAFAGLGITGGVTGVLLGLFGMNWLLSLGWVIVVVTAALVVGVCVALVLTASIGRRPRIEIGPDGFVARNLLGSRSRRWSDIEGDFVVIKVGLGKGVAYRLTQRFKDSARIKPTTLFAGNDEAISGSYGVSSSELAEILNRHKGRATAAS
jgi:Bacterial PH domain